MSGPVFVYVILILVPLVTILPVLVPSGSILSLSQQQEVGFFAVYSFSQCQFQLLPGSLMLALPVPFKSVLQLNGSKSSSSIVASLVCVGSVGACFILASST